MNNPSSTNIFKNWDKICYISSKLPSKEDEYGNQIELYDTPVKYKFNYQPLSSQEYATIQRYGGQTESSVRALLDYNKFIGKIKEFDLAYLYGATPIGEKINGENANYRVVKALPQNTKILVYFEPLTKNKGGIYD